MWIVLAGLFLTLMFLGLWLVPEVYFLPLSDSIGQLRILIKALYSYINHFIRGHVAYTLRLVEHTYFVRLLNKIRGLAGRQSVSFIRAVYL